MNLGKLKELACGALAHSENIGEDEWFSASEVRSMMLAHELDAAFIAAANPSVVLALIEVAEKARAHIDSEGSGCGAEVEHESALRSALSRLEESK